MTGAAPTPPAKRPGLALPVRSALFNAGFYGGTAVLAVALLPALALPRGALIAAGRLWARWTNFLLRTAAGVEISIENAARLPAGACIVAAKHQSAWETIALLGLLRDPAYVLKRELLRVPLLGRYIRKNRQIAVDRGGGPRALRAMLARAAEAAAEGRQIVVFPQGTRVAPGAEAPYLPGVAALYARLGVPVVPVALNSGAVWGRNAFLKRPGRIVLRALEPIAPGLPRAAFMAELERRIETAVRALPGAPPAGAENARTP